MKSLLLVLSLLALLVSGSRAAQPFTISLPDGFSGPETAARGPVRLFAFSRPGVDPTVKTLFQVTVVDIPTEGKTDSLEKMLGSMLRGVERRRIQAKWSREG